MRRVLLCTLLVLALPQFAAAGVMDLVAAPVMTGGQALEAAAAGTAPPHLDLRVDEGHLRVAQKASDDEQAGDASRAEGGDASRAEGGDAPRAKGDISPYEAQSDRGLSFDFEVRPRSRYGDLARKDGAEDPDLGDRLDKLIERPVFGFRGRYRF